MQNKFISFWHIRIYFLEKFKERTLGTRQLKNMKSHTGIFLRVKRRAFCACVSERRTTQEDKHMLILSKRQESWNVSCHTVVHMSEIWEWNFCRGYKIECGIFSTKVLKNKKAPKNTQRENKKPNCSEWLALSHRITGDFPPLSFFCFWTFQIFFIENYFYSMGKKHNFKKWWSTHQR